MPLQSFPYVKYSEYYFHCGSLLWDTELSSQASNMLNLLKGEKKTLPCDSDFNMPPQISHMSFAGAQLIELVTSVLKVSQCQSCKVKVSLHLLSGSRGRSSSPQGGQKGD